MAIIEKKPEEGERNGRFRAEKSLWTFMFFRHTVLERLWRRNPSLDCRHVAAKAQPSCTQNMTYVWEPRAALLLIKPPQFRSNRCMHPHTWMHYYTKHMHSLWDYKTRLSANPTWHKCIWPTGRFHSFQSLSDGENTTHRVRSLQRFTSKETHTTQFFPRQENVKVKTLQCIK